MTNYQARRRAVLKAASAQKVRAVLITKVQDVSYLSGFSGDDSYLVVTPDWTCLVTDGRYDEQARGECPDVDVYVRTGPMHEAVADAIKRHRPRNLGFQASHLTVEAAEKLSQAVSPRKFKPLTDIVTPLRMQKDEEEIRQIRKAVRIAEQAFKEMLSIGRKGFIGRTEREVSAEFEYRMRCAGADGAAFPTIVAAGAHSSLPHYQPDNTVIQKDQVVLIDWGARINGYCSDLTRVLVTGRIPPKLGEIYQVVRCAQKAGIEAVRPGVACKTADATARRVIAKAGYGPQFAHSLGHGLGREVHEGPALSSRASDRLKTGMIVTVEPGIYVPGLGGIRIEDDVLVTKDGRRRLSSLPTDIRAMVLG